MTRAPVEWPAGTDAVFAAFCEAGLWAGLASAVAHLPAAGITTAQAVTEERLRDVPKVGPVRAGRLYSAWVAAGPAYDVVRLLVPAGVPARQAVAVVDALGDTAADALEAEPWRLLEVGGTEVDVADRFARVVLGPFAPDDPRRAAALVRHALALEARDGHTAALVADVADRLRGWSVPDASPAVAATVDDGSVRRADSADGPLLALRRYAVAETTVAERIAALLAAAKPLGTKKAVTRATGGLDERQAAAVAGLAGHGVSVLTGGPGTGKSRTVAAVVALAAALDLEVALAAPTGRAAKRLSELTDAEATTVHRLLEAQGKDGGFARGPGHPLEADVVVVDESSMLDVLLAAALLDAVPDGTHVLFVGDTAQLPSIGPGTVLADVVGCGGVPVTSLETLYRHSAGGQIATLATGVRRGELLPVDDPTREVVVVPARGSSEAAHRAVQLVTDSIPRALGIPAEEIQVVTPVHRGPAGTVELNRALKKALNPGPGAVSGYDVGDRVVATANHLDASPVGYANGEVGTVTGLGGKGLTVDFGSGTAEVAGKALRDLRHGWAITVHRAQGSEWQAVVVVLPPESGRLLTRSLVYTALTRAQRHLSVVHAGGRALAYAVREVATRPRRTTLAARLTASLDDSAQGSARHPV